MHLTYSFHPPLLTIFSVPESVGRGEQCVPFFPKWHWSMYEPSMVVYWYAEAGSPSRIPIYGLTLSSIQIGFTNSVSEIVQ